MNNLGKQFVNRILSFKSDLRLVPVATEISMGEVVRMAAAGSNSPTLAVKSAGLLQSPDGHVAAKVFRDEERQQHKIILVGLNAGAAFAVLFTDDPPQHYVADRDGVVRIPLDASIGLPNEPVEVAVPITRSEFNLENLKSGPQTIATGIPGLLISFFDPRSGRLVFLAEGSEDPVPTRILLGGQFSDGEPFSRMVVFDGGQAILELPNAYPDVVTICLYR